MKIMLPAKLVLAAALQGMAEIDADRAKDAAGILSTEGAKQRWMWEWRDLDFLGLHYPHVEYRYRTEAEVIAWFSWPGNPYRHALSQYWNQRDHLKHMARMIEGLLLNGGVDPEVEISGDDWRWLAGYYPPDEEKTDGQDTHS